MNHLEIFENNEFGKVRTIEEDGRIYFVAKDITDSLGYLNSSKAISDHCKGVTKRYVPHPQSPSKEIEVNVIPEGDIYRLAAKSELPTAEKFESWVFDEVLPSIRKHGTYMTPETIEEVLLNPDTIIKIATALKEEQTKNKTLRAENTAQRQIIGELKPKADYTDSILNNKGLVTTTQIAKDYGMSAKTFNEILHELNIQFKQSDQWFLYQKYHNKGYTHSQTISITRSDGRPDVKMQTKWTQKGRLFLYETLKNHGVIPIIEKGNKTA